MNNLLLKTKCLLKKKKRTKQISCRYAFGVCGEGREGKCTNVSSNFLPLRGDDADYDDNAEREEAADEDSDSAVREPCFFFHNCNKLFLQKLACITTESHAPVSEVTLGKS